MQNNGKAGLFHIMKNIEYGKSAEDGVM